MSATIEKQLNESLRDAQLALYLHEIVPNNEDLKTLNIATHLNTANDLYHYWLLDVLVSQDVPTSQVDCAIASLQQYINSILANMEPGYNTAIIPPDQLETWRTVMHHYSTWASSQQLHYFPAIYLDPTLRTAKTESFQQLENDLNQNQLTSRSVQTAVVSYLTKFEEISNLKTLNGYIDGSDFANSTYYFIAKSRAANTYYWRSLDMSMRPESPPTTSASTTDPKANSDSKYDTPEPQAWSDWKRINLPISESAIEHTIRPVMFNNRLYVIWAECIFQDKNSVSGVQTNSRAPANPLFRLNMCYKNYDESWSTPQTCLQGYGGNEMFHAKTLTELKGITHTVAVHDGTHSTESLLVVLYVGNNETGKTENTEHNLKAPFWMAAHIDKDSESNATFSPKNVPENPPKQEDGKNLLDRLKTEFGKWVTVFLPVKAETERNVNLQFRHSTSNFDLKPPRIKSSKHTTLGTAEFIDFSDSDIKHSNYQETRPRAPVRLNITFAKYLIHRAETSMDELLSWDSQHLQEPAMEQSKGEEKMDFYGAYGRYFVELFLYLPWLVAHRFNQSSQYSEAERWLHYLFNPSRKDVKGGHPSYWNAVPLISVTPEPGQSTYAIQGPQDPHQIALSHPVHFRKALYMLYIDILINRGDMAYRSLAPDELAQAKLWYIRAQDLLGPRPDLKQTDEWAPTTLGAFIAAKNEELRTFEYKQGTEKKHINSSDSDNPVPEICVRPYAPPPSVHAIDTPHLRLPFNPVLIARWGKLESRLHNLRHNLDIVGKPLRLPLFTAPAIPAGQLGANPQRAAEPEIYQRLGSTIPPYRFSVMHAQAMSAVETVIQFGNTLLSFIERAEQAFYQETQQQHIWDMANIAVDLQTQALKVDQKNKEALLASKTIVQERERYYSERVDEVINPEEAAAAASHLAGRIAEASAYAAQVIGQGLKVVPNIFGMADGGHRVEGIPLAVMAGAQGLAAAAHGTGEALERAAQYRRRHQEWTLARDQARLEIAQLDAQLALEAEREIASALQLRQTQTTLMQARSTYTFLTKRFTNAQLYQWFTGQMSIFYYQAYDSALSLCQFTEQCWCYEMADTTTQSFFQPKTWNSTYRGLGPGEPMKLGLVKMKTAYLLGNERELEIRKTVSLRQLKEKDAKTGAIHKVWEDGVTKDGFKDDLVKNGSCHFELTQSLFDDDYPGHCLRRIKSISISLPTTLGPYEDIRALLTQTSSEVVMPGAEKKSIKGQRANQQVALSTGIDDSGLLTLNFQDERYLPFEYTGAISKWKLSFPNHVSQKAMLESLTDIIVHVQYTARVDGGEQ